MQNQQPWVDEDGMVHLVRFDLSQVNLKDIRPVQVESWFNDLKNPKDLKKMGRKK